jgi:4-cresol dehydrogenase (hydroxylating)
MTLVPPPGTSEAALAGALDRLAAALGPGAVLTDEARLREFRDPFTWAGWEDHRAAAVVMPETVEQVQEVVRVANEFRIPLWTSSQGRNNAYGGAAPRLSGSIQVSLRRMDRVLEVNEPLAYAVVEPGVSFFGLYDHLREHGHRLWPQVPDIGWGSVIGNTLDHGLGNCLPGQHPDRACGIEVVLANGEVLRTGMGALPGSRAWHASRRGFGPALDPLFMQSNFGIVTKMGVWCLPEPEVYLLCLVTCDREEGIAALVDGIRPFLVDGTVPAGLSLTRDIDTRLLIELKEKFDRGETSREEVVRAMRARSKSAWLLRWPLYGPAEVVDAQWARIRRAFADVPGVEFAERRFTGDDVHTKAENHAEKGSGGVPNDDLLVLLDLWPGEAGHLDFSPMAPVDGADAVALMKLLRPIVEGAGLVYNPTFMISGRTMFHIVPTLFDTRNEAQVRAAFDDMYPKAIAACAGRLRPVPDAHRLHGHGHGDLLVQRPRPAPLPRAGQGRGRPERHPLARKAGHLAGAAAIRAPTGRETR